MKKTLLNIGLLSLLMLGASWQIAATARQSITITRDDVAFDFPNEINFALEAASDVPIERVELEYGLDVNACATDTTRVVPDDVEPGAQIAVTWTWNMRRSGSLPPGSRMWYRWRLTDANGETFVSEQTWLTWLDDIHNWQTISNDNLYLHWYQGDTDFAQALLDAGVESQARIERDIGAEQTKDVHLYIYGTTDELRDAILFEPGWTGGLAYSNSNIVLIGVSERNLEWGLDTVAHELAHVIIGNSFDSCYASVPTWLNEGLAVYAEGPLNAGSANVLQDAIDDNNVYSVPALSEGFSEHPGRAQVSYAQSYSLTAYLIETYGQEKMRQLLRQFDEGYRYEAALENTYGLTVAEFEAEWRESKGLPPVAVPTEAVIAPTVYPTFAPYGGQTVTAATATPIPTSQALPTPPGGGEAPDSTENASTLLDWQNLLSGFPLVVLLCTCLFTLTIVIAIPVVLFFMGSRRKSAPADGGLTDVE